MKFFFTYSSIYSLKKSKIVLRHGYHLFQRKKKKLSSSAKEDIQKTLQNLQDEILQKNQQRAHELAKQVEALCDMHLKKNLFDHLRDLFFALLFARCMYVCEKADEQVLLGKWIGPPKEMAGIFFNPMIRHS